MSLSRRAVLGSGLALAACSQKANSQPTGGPVPPLKSLAPFPIGTAVQAGQLTDPAFAALVTEHFSQLTPEWEMKMEYTVLEDGSFRFDRPDAIAAFARARGQRLFGHALVWYAQEPPAFQRLDETRASFGQAYDRYITAAVGRYRGQASGWDVVNEPIRDDGSGLREHLWSRRLGEIDHMVRAFQVAQAADPDIPLFINDYNLESNPAKLDQYQRLIERLLRAGAPLTGIGCQTHCNADLPAGSLTRTINALARFGLKVHVSEIDVSLVRAGGRFVSRQEKEAAQARLYAEAITAFAALRPEQQFAFTIWGVRDPDSWLVREDASDAPLLFDGQGRAKGTFRALEAALRG
ncbi:1,4-beta-xylanase [Caulobacter sp. SLTY]|uniref:endo-1,4-beta-xylanase n=1 Tax=Caulobacter sp. SLTY TaxID=2683262 RepID=UPI0014125912|nr:1,4-beta-xylanase [Caulobacter sp. SLTY]